MNLSPYYNPKNNMASMPFTWISLFTNGGTVCDMLEGPCACGAWHHQYEWPDVLQVSVFGSVKVDPKWDRLFKRRRIRKRRCKMLLCNNGHQEVYYEAGDCPLCKCLDEKDELKWEIDDLKDDIYRLEKEIGNLQ